MHPIAAHIPSATVLINLLNVGIAATVACGTALLLTRWSRNRPLPLEHAVLVIALAASLASPIVVGVSQSSAWSLVRVKLDDASQLSPQGSTGVRLDQEPEATPEPVQELASERPTGDAAVATFPAAPPAPPDKHLATGAPSSSGWWLLRLVGTVLALIWAGGCLFSAAKLVRGYAQLRRLARIWRPLPDPRINYLASQAAGRLGLRKAPPIYACDQITAPLAIGLFRTSIVIPPAVARCFADDQLRGMLIHEMAHAVRHDHLVGLLQRLSLMTFWWNPLVRRVSRRISSVREQICDDIAINGTQGAEDYARMLVELAGRLAAVRPLPLAIGISEGTGDDFSSRVRRLLDRERLIVTCTGKRMALTCAAVFFLIVAVISLTLIRVQSAAATATLVDESVSRKTNTPGAQADQSAPSPKGNGDAASATESTEGESAVIYTFPITVSGRALDSDGKPIPGAQVYLTSQHATRKRVSETKTDESGNYVFEKAPLPIKRADENIRYDRGAFLIYAQAEARGFSWRPAKDFLPVPRNGRRDYFVQEGDLPKRYYADEDIKLDLHFTESTNIRGTVMDTKGNPIPDTMLSIWDAERIPPGGYGPDRPLNHMDNEGFGMLNADVPPDMQLARTNASGRFELRNVPTGCRFRIQISPPGFPERSIWVAAQPGLAAQYDGTPLYSAAEDIKLTFGIPKKVPIQVVYGDTGKPAAKALVLASNEDGSTYDTTNDRGEVLLPLSPGDYSIKVLPRFKTPYLETFSNVTTGEKQVPSDTVVRLRPAAQVEIKVLDKATGKGIANVDLWTEDGAGRRDLHYATSYEAETRIVHRDRPKTDKSGVITTLFEPGKHRLGVALQFFPQGYRPLEENGVEFYFIPGEKAKLTFHLRQTNSK